MAVRASWKGTLRVADLACRVGLYVAASTGGRTVFHTVNRATGNRVQRVFADSETGDIVPAEDQAKGYGDADQEPVVLEPAEIAAVIPESDKTIAIDQFIACTEVDTVYFDKPYFLAPADGASREAFAVLRDAMQARHVAAIAHAVLFRRLRGVLIRPQGAALIAHTLHFDYEVRAADHAFAALKPRRVDGEMLKLAQHIIETKSGSFDAAAFEDRYETALAELVRAKMSGRKLPALPRAREKPPADLMQALRESAAGTGAPPPRPRRAAKPKPAGDKPKSPRRKAA